MAQRLGELPFTSSVLPTPGKPSSSKTPVREQAGEHMLDELFLAKEDGIERLAQAGKFRAGLGDLRFPAAYWWVMGLFSLSTD